MQNKATYIFWGKAILFALLLVFVVRTFWLESYVISSSQMEDSLVEGDRVLVNKTAYGLRLPMTPLTIPFTYDNLLGWRSYSTAIELPYKRLGKCQIPLNDVVVYNHPLQTTIPLDKRTLCIGRCVALPGDTVRVDAYDLYVNNRHYQTSPNYLIEYTIPLTWKDSLTNVMHQLEISEKKMVVEKNKILLLLNRLDSYMVKEYLPDSIFQSDKSNTLNYEVVIPKKGMKIALDEENVNIYNYLISQEMGKGEKPTTEYTFRDNYYWFLSDNQKDAIDSRHLGFVSERNVVGKATFVWFSHSGKRIFTSVK